MPRLLCGVLVAVLLLPCLAGQARADYINSTLGSAGPSDYGLLILSTSPNPHINGPGISTGNIGLSSPSNLNLDNPAVVNGNLFLGNTASFQNTGTLNGNIFTNQDARLNAANAAALNAAKVFGQLATSKAFTGVTSINGTTALTGTTGTNVLNLSSINLGNKQTLTLTGPAGTQFVINDSGGLVLNSGIIVLGGGVTPSDVVVNVMGDVQTSGGLNNESIINGIVLDIKGNINLSPGQVNGEVIAGGNTVQFASGATFFQTSPVPEPSAFAIAFSALPALIGVPCLRRIRRRLAA
jgi:hypothetical protein